MSSAKNRNKLHNAIAIPIALILLAALFLSIGSVFENLRFVNSTGQILRFVSTVRLIATEQKTLTFNSGEDVWGDMVNLGQITPETKRLNPWGGAIRATAVANMAMRIETDLPDRDCRRIALYFLGLHPAELGLLSVEAQPTDAGNWVVVYPGAEANQAKQAEAACGKTLYSRLALIFRIR